MCVVEHLCMCQWPSKVLHWILGILNTMKRKKRDRFVRFSVSLSAHFGSLRAFRWETHTGSASFKSKTGCSGPDHISWVHLCPLRAAAALVVCFVSCVCSHPHNVSVTVFIRAIFNSLLVCFIFCHHTSFMIYTPCFCPPSIFRTKIADYLLLLYIFIMHYKFNTAVVLSQIGHNCRVIVDHICAITCYFSPSSSGC